MKVEKGNVLGLAVRLTILVLVVSIIDHRQELMTGTTALKIYNFTWDCLLLSIFVGCVSAWILYRFFPYFAERMRHVLSLSDSK